MLRFLVMLISPMLCVGAENRRESYLFDKVSVKSGRATVRLSPAETISFEIEADQAVDTQGDSPGATEKITVRNVVVKSNEARDDGTIDLIAATIRRNRNGGGRIDELRIVNPKLTVSGGMLRSIMRLATGAPAVREDDAEAEQLSPVWTIGEISIEGADVSVRDFGDGAPIIRAEFDYHDSDIRFGGEPIPREKEIQRVIALRNVNAAAAFERQEPFFRAQQIELKFTTEGLERRKEIDQVLLDGLSMEFGREFRSLLSATKEENAAPAPTESAGEKPEKPWLIRKLEIAEGQVVLADLGDPIPDIQFDAASTLENIYLTGDPSYGDENLRTVELANITIHSPLDPFVPVANLHSIFIRFSIAGLLQKNISEVVVLSPMIFIGPDLFWYVDALKSEDEEMSSQSGKEEADQEAAEWTIDAFEVASGKLVVASGGEARLTLPIGFSSRAENIRFSNLSELQLKMNFLVPESDYRFPSYKLEFEDFGGNIEFGLPPDSGANNLVQTLRAVGMKWRQFDAANLWLSVTYDQNGIYGSFGGAAYRGYLSGSFTVFLQAASPWTGWVSATNLSLEEITRIVTPQTLSISGPGSVVVEVNGRTRLIERVRGTIVASEPGEFRIGKLDDLIRKIPSSWTTLKQSVTRIGLETLRDFQYETCNGEFWYAGDLGEIKLRLAGPTGSRNFHVELHPKN